MPQHSLKLIAVVSVFISCCGCRKPGTHTGVLNAQPLIGIPPSQIHPATAPSAPAQRVRSIGKSTQGRSIDLYRFDSRSSADAPNEIVIVFAGIHGDEPTSVFAARKLIELLTRSDNSHIAPGTTVIVIPVVNPDGLAASSRRSAAGVDLNRNFPAQNWNQAPRGSNWNGSSPLSEPESRLLHDLVLELKPARILALHSIHPPRHGNNFDGPAQGLAELMAMHNRYSVLPTIGYPTPGSFGSWAGVDLKIPTITLEFPSTASGEAAWEENRDAILAFIRGR